MFPTSEDRILTSYRREKDSKREECYEVELLVKWSPLVALKETDSVNLLHADDSEFFGRV
jgi:hypothetical protein